MLTGDMMTLDEGDSDLTRDTNTLSEIDCTESAKTFFGDRLNLDSSSLSLTGTEITNPSHAVNNTLDVVFLIVVVCMLVVDLTVFPG